jgi:hypothetical protein
VTLLIVVGSSSLAVPARADTGPPGRRSALTTVSVKTLEKLREQSARNTRASQSAATSEPGFFKTRKGAIAVGLMAAGAAFTVWSINHDRKPVKSPIR